MNHEKERHLPANTKTQVGVMASGEPVHSDVPLIVLADEAQQYFGGETGSGKSAVVPALMALLAKRGYDTTAQEGF